MSDASPFSAFHRAIMREQRALGRRPGALPPSETKQSTASRERIAEIQRAIYDTMADGKPRSIKRITERVGAQAHDVRFALVGMVADGRMSETKGVKNGASSFRRAKG